MTATCIVLNGTSCSGKSSIAAVLQQLWPRPLQVTGMDTFLASQSARFFASEVGGEHQAVITINSMPAPSMLLFRLFRHRHGRAHSGHITSRSAQN
jgi:chloramphenicol 3-O-phosphotransferase